MLLLCFRRVRVETGQKEGPGQKEGREAEEEGTPQIFHRSEPPFCMAVAAIQTTPPLTYAFLFLRRRRGGGSGERMLRAQQLLFCFSSDRDGGENFERSVCA